jgi:DNA processing protein
VKAPPALAPRIIVRRDPGWPAELSDLSQCPERLWLLGAAEHRPPAVAVVGSRRATLAGLGIAAWLGRSLAEAGVQVISGMALGIDGAAHRGALASGGTTVAVLGCGIDICYPPRHAALRRRIIDAGLLITEEPPGTPALAYHFPKRNRIIAALCAAVIVVEASERSGALSTARHAADLGREVLAVPGSIRNPAAIGCNLLLRDGATPLLRIPDLFDAVPALRAHAASVACADGARSPSGQRGDRLLRLLGPDPVHPDDLASELGLSAQKVATRLTQLEIAGLVATIGGGLVVRRHQIGPGPVGPAAGSGRSVPEPLL